MKSKNSQQDKTLRSNYRGQLNSVTKSDKTADMVSHADTQLRNVASGLTKEKEKTRTDTLLCVKCGNLINIDDVAKMYIEEGQNSQKEKDLEIIDKRIKLIKEVVEQASSISGIVGVAKIKELELIKQKIKGEK